MHKGENVIERFYIMANEPNDTLCVPMKLDAFVLNTSVCDGENSSAKIAPITQPNYTFLRLHDSLIQVLLSIPSLNRIRQLTISSKSDVLPHLDIHNTHGDKFNSRITNLENGKTYLHRQGVYLHWMLPRIYRAGAAATEESKLNRDGDGLPDPDSKSELDQTAPQFRPVPTRWLVIRHLRQSTPDYKSVSIPEYTAWVVESDHQQEVDSVGEETDLQVDVSPYIVASSGDVQIQKQAEIFIGKKTLAKDWTEPNGKVAPLTVLNGGNLLFPDFQPHNGNVFSILDNFEIKSGDDAEYLESATADYYVIGWHARPEEGLEPFDPKASLY